MEASKNRSCCTDTKVALGGGYCEHGVHGGLVVSVMDCRSRLGGQIPTRAEICTDISAPPGPLSYNKCIDHIHCRWEHETVRETIGHPL